MSNNKKQTVVQLIIQSLDIECKSRGMNVNWDMYLQTEKEEIEQAKAKYEHEICVFADEYASYVLEQSKSGIKGAMVSMCAWTFFKNRRNEQQ